MAAVPSSVTAYLGRRGVSGPWMLEGSQERGFAGAVVIPSLAENPLLFRTLASLAANDEASLRKFLVVVVVNHRPDALPEDVANNRETLDLLRKWSCSSSFNLSWVDAASPGRELPTGSGGVGLARKMGFDLALGRLDFTAAPILVALDADTLVQRNYLSTIRTHFEAAAAGGASIPFRHQEGDTASGRQAILLYELFLRAYVIGLSYAKSPYAFHTVGSAMACTADAYVRMGGMNTRSAAEDFYFLQQLQRTGGVGRVHGTCVFPSARASHRVPFGTGRTISRFLSEEKGAVSFYQPDCYDVLSAWLDLVTEGPEKPVQDLLAAAAGISPDLADFITACGFGETWPRLQRHNRTPRALIGAFHGWFDGLKTMKLIHHLSAVRYPRGPAELHLPGLFRLAGIPQVEGAPESWLKLTRNLQGAFDGAADFSAAD